MIRPSQDDALASLLQALRHAAQGAHHRLTLVLAGGRDWTLGTACAALDGLDALWLTERLAHAPHVWPLEAATRLLGQELDLLVYDAHSGFDPDGFGAASGALRGGGLLLLLSPPLAAWPATIDPLAHRIAAHPFTAADVGCRFIRRLVRAIETAPGCWILAEGQALPAPSWPTRHGTRAVRLSDDPASPLPPISHPDRAATPDQQRAIAGIVKMAHGRARRPLVLRADRGRGKTAALGLATAQLLTSGTTPILVTAPRRAAVEPLFRHALTALSDARRDRAGLTHRHTRLTFIAPDDLDLNGPEAALLLVDEAAAIPAPLLERMLARYPRIVFATTVHGYEGTGRGFDVRFRAKLDQHTPDWHTIILTTPIRWAANDPLEALAGQALLLDAAPVESHTIAAASITNSEIVTLERDRLATDETTLRQLFGLLVLAHYQTRPLDLRHLLDGPNAQLQALRHNGAIVATLVSTDEGALARDLSQAIFAGHRRPRGHLLPQTLAAHAGLADAPRLRYRRIIRLAVHPAVQRRGLARRLLDATLAKASAEGIDCVGASFGATTALIAFWAHCGFLPAQLGTHRNAASGAHGLVMLRPLTVRGTRLLDSAQARLAARLPSLLPGPLRRIPPQLMALLLAELPGRDAGLDEAALYELTGFADAKRCFEATLPLLIELATARLGPALCTGRLDLDQAAALVGAVLQRHDPGAIASSLGYRGRDDLIARLRRATQLLLAKGRPSMIDLAGQYPGQPSST